MAAEKYSFRYHTEGRASALASRLSDSRTTMQTGIATSTLSSSSSSASASSASSSLRQEPTYGGEHEAKSVRWFHLVRAVYLETVVSSFPSATVHDVEYLLDLFDWLLGKGQKLAEQEFSVAWQRWKSRGGAAASSFRRRTSSTGEREPVANEVSEERFRRILSRRGFGERKVDLVLSVLIKECNTELVAESGPNVDEEWIRIGHEIFFVLDAPGYGYITIEELRHLVASMVQAMPLGSSSGDRSFASDAFVESATIDLALRMGGILPHCSYPMASTPSSSSSIAVAADSTGLAGEELLKETRHGAFTLRDFKQFFSDLPNEKGRANGSTHWIARHAELRGILKCLRSYCSRWREARLSAASRSAASSFRDFGYGGGASLTLAVPDTDRGRASVGRVGALPRLWDMASLQALVVSSAAARQHLDIAGGVGPRLNPKQFPTGAFLLSDALPCVCRRLMGHTILRRVSEDPIVRVQKDAELDSILAGELWRLYSDRLAASALDEGKALDSDARAQIVLKAIERFAALRAESSLMMPIADLLIPAASFGVSFSDFDVVSGSRFWTALNLGARGDWYSHEVEFSHYMNRMSRILGTSESGNNLGPATGLDVYSSADGKQRHWSIIADGTDLGDIPVVKESLVGTGSTEGSDSHVSNVLHAPRSDELEEMLAQAVWEDIDLQSLMRLRREQEAQDEDVEFSAADANGAMSAAFVGGDVVRGQGEDGVPGEEEEAEKEEVLEDNGEEEEEGDMDEDETDETDGEAEEEEEEEEDQEGQEEIWEDADSTHVDDNHKEHVVEMTNGAVYALTMSAKSVWPESDVIIASLLTKKGSGTGWGSRRNWRQRYFVLSARPQWAEEQYGNRAQLCYYDNADVEKQLMHRAKASPKSRKSVVGLTPKGFVCIDALNFCRIDVTNKYDYTFALCREISSAEGLLHHPNDGKSQAGGSEVVLVMRASCSEDRDRWVDAINRAIGARAEDFSRASKMNGSGGGAQKTTTDTTKTKKTKKKKKKKKKTKGKVGASGAKEVNNEEEPGRITTESAELLDERAVVKAATLTPFPTPAAPKSAVAARVSSPATFVGFADDSTSGTGLSESAKMRAKNLKAALRSMTSRSPAPVLGMAAREAGAGSDVWEATLSLK